MNNKPQNKSTSKDISNTTKTLQTRMIHIIRGYIKTGRNKMKGKKNIIMTSKKYIDVYVKDDKKKEGFTVDFKEVTHFTYIKIDSNKLTKRPRRFNILKNNISQPTS